MHMPCSARPFLRSLIVLQAFAPDVQMLLMLIQQTYKGSLGPGQQVNVLALRRFSTRLC
jgi:hypothetical protein